MLWKDGVGDLLREVKGWSKEQWCQQLRETALACPTDGRARLFWVLSRHSPSMVAFRDHLKMMLPSVEVEWTEDGKVGACPLLEAVLRWEEGRIELCDPRLRSMCHAFRHYVDYNRLTHGLGKLQPTIAESIDEIESRLGHTVVNVEEMHFKRFRLLRDLDTRPPAMKISVGNVLDKYTSVMNNICQEPEPPELNWKFGTFWPGDPAIYHPNLFLILSNQILQLARNTQRIADMQFISAMHLTVWLLGMYGPRPFAGRKDSEQAVWGCVSVLLGLDSCACRTEVEYVFG